MNINKFLIILNFIFINSLKFQDLINNFQNKESILLNSNEKTLYKNNQNEDLLEISDYERINPDDQNFCFK